MIHAEQEAINVYNRFRKKKSNCFTQPMMKTLYRWKIFFLACIDKNYSF